MSKEMILRNRTTNFGQVFSSEGVTVYYGYLLWADVLTSEAAEAFAEAKGSFCFYGEALANKLVCYFFEPRNAIDSAEAYRQFRGRDAKIDAILRDRGFPIK